MTRWWRKNRSVEGTDRSWHLLRAWRDASAKTCWVGRHDWYSPALDAVAEALAEHRDPIPAVQRLAGNRAAVGVPLDEALDDLATAFRVSQNRDPSFDVVRAFSVAWTETWVEPVASAGCDDPLTGLATAGHLRARVAELYHEIEGDPARTHVLLLVDVALDPTALAIDPWRRVAVRCLLADAVREAVPQASTAAVVADARVAVLVRRELADDAAVLVRAVCTERFAAEVAGGAVRLPPRIWRESLPPAPGQAFGLLAELAR